MLLRTAASGAGVGGGSHPASLALHIGVGVLARGACVAVPLRHGVFDELWLFQGLEPSTLVAPLAPAGGGKRTDAFCLCALPIDTTL